MAQQVLDAITKAEPGVPPAQIDFDDAFDRDKLLNDMPKIWGPGLWLWRDVRRALAGQFLSPADQDHEKAFCEVVAACAQTVGRRGH